MTSTTAPHEPPPTLGWPGVVGAIVSLRRMAAPMALAITSPDFGTVWVDLTRDRYHSEYELEQMPASPSSIGIATQALAPGQELFPGARWRALDPFLWHVGRSAFGDAEASWMRGGDRYRLSRWPDLTQLPHGADEIRIIAALGAGQDLTVQETVELAGVDGRTARSVMNALSLMGCLDAVAGPVEPPPVIAQATRRAARERATRQGLFGRLRARLTGVANG